MPYVLLAGVVYGACLVATIPAGVGAALLEHFSNRSLHVENPRGTLWRGEADALLVALPDQALRLERIAWRLSTWRLLTGELAAMVTLADPRTSGSGNISLRASRLRMGDVKLTLPASFVAAQTPLLAVWKPEGVVAINAATLDFAGHNINGTATILWQRASLALSPVRPLGDYRLTIEARGQKASLGINTLTGALLLDAEGNFSSTTGIQLSGNARPAPGFETQLAPVLDLMGPRRPDGSVGVRLNLPPPHW